VKYKFLIQLTGFLFTGATLLRGEPASASTTFQCVNADSSYVTIAVSSSGKKTRPLIVWNSVTFAQSSSTPKQLCERVTARLNMAVANNGSRLTGLLLTVGEVNGYDYICYVNNNQSGCNTRNLLMALPPGTEPEQALERLLNVPADMYVPNPFLHSARDPYLRFGAAVERELAAENSSSASSNKSTSRFDKGVDDTTRTFAQSSSQVDSSVAEMARLVTVRILTKLGAGSGVIVDRQGQTYTVLTCDHVANPSPDDRFTVLTPDGQIHSAYRKRLPSLEGVDLALVQFESRSPYRVAALGNSKDLSVGEPVYASGFPNYQYQGSNSVEETLNWGLKAYRLTTGTIAMLLSNQSLPRGYQLGYTNDIEPGMSGGPVLDRQGRLIGINGRGKHPIQGIDAFTLADGTTPSQELFKRMEALSWAVPISRFVQRSGQLPAATGVRSNLSLPPSVTDSPLAVPPIAPPMSYPNGSLSL
jgi:S1-C subfamily serine protease